MSTTYPPADVDRRRLSSLFSVLTSPNATESDIPGAGRTLGRLLSRSGRAFEALLDRAAERLGWGPNVLAQRVLSVLSAGHRHDIGPGRDPGFDLASEDGVATRTPVLRGSERPMAFGVLVRALVELGSGRCAQCGQPRLGDPAALEACAPLLHKMVRCLRQDNASARFLATHYLLVFVYLHNSLRIVLRRLGAVAALEASLEEIEVLSWEMSEWERLVRPTQQALHGLARVSVFSVPDLFALLDTQRELTRGELDSMRVTVAALLEDLRPAGIVSDLCALQVVDLLSRGCQTRHDTVLSAILHDTLTRDTIDFLWEEHTSSEVFLQLLLRTYQQANGPCSSSAPGAAERSWHWHTLWLPLLDAVCTRTFEPCLSGRVLQWLLELYSWLAAQTPLSFTHIASTLDTRQKLELEQLRLDLARPIAGAVRDSPAGDLVLALEIVEMALDQSHELLALLSHEVPMTHGVLEWIAHSDKPLRALPVEQTRDICRCLANSVLHVDTSDFESLALRALRAVAREDPLCRHYLVQYLSEGKDDHGQTGSPYAVQALEYLDRFPEPGLSCTGIKVASSAGKHAPDVLYGHAPAERAVTGSPPVTHTLFADESALCWMKASELDDTRAHHLPVTADILRPDMKSSEIKFYIVGCRASAGSEQPAVFCITDSSLSERATQQPDIYVLVMREAMPVKVYWKTGPAEFVQAVTGARLGQGVGDLLAESTRVCDSPMAVDSHGD